MKRAIARRLRALAQRLDPVTISTTIRIDGRVIDCRPDIAAALRRRGRPDLARRLEHR